MSEKRISYLDRNFDDYKNSLLNISRQYYGDLFNNFNDASIGSWFVDLFADIADNLSYHIDRTYQETDIDSAHDINSILSIARNQGIKIPGPKSAIVEIELSCELPLDNLNQRLADENYAPYIKRGTLFSTGTITFELYEDVDFKEQFNNNGMSNRQIIPKRDSNGNIISYIYKKLAIAISGQSKIYKKVITSEDIKPFMSILLTDNNILGIESIIIKESKNTVLNNDPSISDFYVDKQEFKDKNEQIIKRFFEVDNLVEQYRFGIDFQNGYNYYNPISEKTYEKINSSNYTDGKYLLYTNNDVVIKNYDSGKYLTGNTFIGVDEEWSISNFIYIKDVNTLKIKFNDDVYSFESKGKALEFYDEDKIKIKSMIYLENETEYTIDNNQSYAYLRFSFYEKIDSSVKDENNKIIYKKEYNIASNFIDNNEWGFSNFIDVTNIGEIIWKPFKTKIYGEYALDEYDEYKNKINSVKAETPYQHILLNENSKYIRCSFYKKDIDYVGVIDEYNEIDVWKPSYIYTDEYVLSESVVKGKWKRLKNKFITEYTNNWGLKIIFGSGLKNKYGEIPNDASYFTQYMMSRMEANDYMGVLPDVDSTMYILYRVGGGSQTNIAKNSLTNIIYLDMDIDGVPCIGNEVNKDDIRKKNIVKNTLKVTNTSPSYGGKDKLSVEELKYYIKYFNGSQNRCVTLKDYESRIMNLPPKFGTPFRCKAIEENNKIIIYTLGLNSNGNLTNILSETVSENIKNYLENYRMLNDFVEIRSGKIFNISFEADVFIDRSNNKSDVIRNIINKIYDYMDIKNHLIGQDIFLGELEKEISNIDGVINLSDLRCFNKIGGYYSNDEMSQEMIDTMNSEEQIENEYQIDLKQSEKILFSEQNSMFEIKNINDIKINVKLR